MSLLALAALTLQGTPATFSGRCEYRRAILEAAPLTVAHECRAVEIGESTIAYFRDARSRAVSFRGLRDGALLAVNEIVLRDGTVLPARGTCRHVRPGAPLSSVLCSAVARGRTYVANLVRRSAQAR